MAAQWIGSRLDFYRPSDVKMSYSDFLQQRELHREVSFEVSGSIKTLIDSTYEHSLAQIRAINEAKDGQIEATYQVVYAVDDLKRATETGFNKVGSILDWGFSEIAILQGRTNDLLSAIKGLIESPSSNWAYEQFRKARELERQGLFEESLDFVDRAINGHGDNVGDYTEFIFHFLRGGLLLGSKRNDSSDFINPVEAEKAFLQAARYAEYDDPSEAAAALLYAARSAFVAERYNDALNHALKGVKLGEMAGLYYEVARSLVALHMLCDAIVPLSYAIELDKELVVKMTGDPVFERHDEFVVDILKKHHEKITEIIQDMTMLFQNELDHIRNLGSLESKVPTCDIDLTRSSEELTVILQGQIERMSCAASIPDIRIAIESGWALKESQRDFDKRLQERIQYFLQSKVSQLSEKQARHQRESLYRRRRAEEFWDSAPFWTGAVVFAILLLSYLSSCSELAQRGDGAVIDAFLGMVIGAPFLSVIAEAIAAIIGKIAKSDGAPEDPYEHHIQQLRRELSGVGSMRFLTVVGSLGQNVPTWARGRHGHKLS